MNRITNRRNGESLRMMARECNKVIGRANYAEW